MSDPQVAPLTIPAFDQTQTIRDWHVLFATQNIEPLRRLQAMTPGRVVMVTIDPAGSRAKVAFRTDQNVKALLSPEEADRVAPEKIVIVTYDGEGTPVATRFRIGED